MTKRRIFIAINLTEGARNKLSLYQEKWPELPVKWTKPRNLHITLIFIGYVDNEGLVDISKLTEEVARKTQPFSIRFSRICYGPLKKTPPRMIWAAGEGSKEFAALKNNLEEAILSSDKISFSPAKRELCPHITLGRIRQWEWRRIEPEERPEIEEDINMELSVDSIEVMESELKKGGAEYLILESHAFGAYEEP